MECRSRIMLLCKTRWRQSAASMMRHSSCFSCIDDVLQSVVNIGFGANPSNFAVGKDGTPNTQSDDACGAGGIILGELAVGIHSMRSRVIIGRGFASSTYSISKEAGDVVGGNEGTRTRGFPIKAEAMYIGSRINIYDLLARKECASNYSKLHKESVIVGLTENCKEIEMGGKGELPLGPYLVATSYGSAVFFNGDQNMKAKWIAVLREVAVEPVSEGRKYTEEFPLSINRDLSAWSLLDPECVQLRILDLRNLQVVAQVLAQSVALDYYCSHVERTLETFCAMNADMADSANIARVDKAQLLRLVAENNIVMTEIISKLGVHERYDIAWKDVRYGRVWEFLRNELEMENRFETLNMKLNLVQDNLKYFLEILQNRKSDALEWTIIVLIAVEIGLSLYELLGKVS